MNKVIVFTKEGITYFAVTYTFHKQNQTYLEVWTKMKIFVLLRTNWQTNF